MTELRTPIFENGLHEVLPGSNSRSIKTFRKAFFERMTEKKSSVLIVCGAPGNGKSTNCAELLAFAEHRIKSLYPNEDSRNKIHFVNWEHAQTWTLFRDLGELSVSFEKMSDQQRELQQKTFASEIKESILLGGYIIVEVPWPVRAYETISNLFSKQGIFEDCPTYEPAMLVLAKATQYRNFQDHGRVEFKDSSISRLKILKDLMVEVHTFDEDDEFFIGGGNIDAVLGLRAGFDDWVRSELTREEFDNLSESEFEARWLEALKLERSRLLSKMSNRGSNRFMVVGGGSIGKVEYYLGHLRRYNHTLQAHPEFEAEIIRQGRRKVDSVQFAVDSKKQPPA